VPSQAILFCRAEKLPTERIRREARLKSISQAIGAPKSGPGRCSIRGTKKAKAWARTRTAELNGGRGLRNFDLAFVGQAFEHKNRGTCGEHHTAKDCIGGGGGDALNEERERAENRACGVHD
jgi:hypothetical protein